MAESAAAAVKAPATPGDSPEAPHPAVKPAAKNRYRLFDDQQGDYRIYEIAGPDHKLPKGTLLPIAEVPGFLGTAQARSFISNSGDMLAGKQFLILKGLEMGVVASQTITKVKATFKTKTPIAGPAATEATGK